MPYHGTSYADRLTKLGLCSLELMRLHLDLILCYKIVFGMVNVSFYDFFLIWHALKNKGTCVYKLYKPQTTKTARKNSFTERVINVWNSLPPVVDFSSLACFKRTIINVDFTEFLKC